MAWPLSQDYNEAIQNPASSFADPELRAGEPATNAMGMPIPRSGNFADVYEFNCPATGNKWALKCFTREMPGLRERYAEISKSLAQLRLPFMVEFQYLEQGIRVRGRWFPLLKMRWVEGYLLNELLRAAADKPATLDALLQVWVRMGQRLRKAGIAHGDLQHGNVLMVPGTTANSMAVKLIDYDGMFMPALAQLKSGEVGHPAYQHPLRLRDGLYTPDVDRFPLLVIYCAIRALKVGGRALWERYDNGDNLLFREQDLRSPRDSALFKDLIKLNDPEVKMLVDQLSRAVYKPLDQVPLLDELVPPKEQASVSLSAKTAPAAATASTAAAPLASFAPAPDVTVSVRRKLGKLIPVGIAAAVLLGTVLTAVWLFAGKGGNKTSKPPEGVQEPWNSGLGIVEIPDKRDPKHTPSNKGDTGRKTPPNKAPSDPKQVKGSEPKDNPPPEGSPLPGQIAQNSIGMKLAYIPAGQFGMGSSDRDKDRERFEKQMNNSEKEGPQHFVKISKGFYMGTCEVTQWQYVKVMGKNPAGNQESPDHPVEKVKWAEAMKFCKKLSERPEEMKVGRIYRLPTEAEWEYACRGDTTTGFNVGDVLEPTQANFSSSGKGGGKTTKVGSYPPNLWGLHDMHGNVYEWCLDGPRVYTAEAAKDPRGPEEDDGAHVLRGGSCYMSALACRSAARKSRDGNYRAEQAGFRVLFEP